MERAPVAKLDQLVHEVEGQVYSGEFNGKKNAIKFVKGAGSLVCLAKLKN